MAVLTTVGGTSAFAYVSVKRAATNLQAELMGHVSAGQAELEAAKTSLKQANATHDPKLIDEAQQHFARAKVEFTSAKKTADDSSLLKQLEAVPGIGATARLQHEAVTDVSDMGIQLSLAGQDLADLDRQLIKPPGGGQQGQNLLTVVNEVQAKTGSVRIELERALAAANRVNSTALPQSVQPTLLRARTSIGHALDAIIQFQSLVPILSEVLGGNGARNYLIEQLNPAELRPGGGFIGTYSILSVNRGALRLASSGDAADLIWPRAKVGQAGYVAPPAPFQTLIGNQSWSFIDSNFFADFPSNAKAGMQFAQSKLGIRLDAVVAIDYYTVTALLAVTGPIAVPGYHLTLTSTNFIQTVIQYDLASFTDPAAVAIHKAVLSAAAGPLLQRLVSLPSSSWPALISALNDLASSRHLQVFFNSGKVQDAMNQYGWSGVSKAASPPTDYMMEVEANLGATKTNFFISRAYRVELTRVGNILRHKVSVDIGDDMPYAYRPREYYRAYIRMFISSGATRVSTDLVGPHYAGLPTPSGANYLDGWIQMHGYGHHRVVQFQWDTPWKANGQGVQQVYWQKQPGTANDAAVVVWNDGSGHTYTAKGNLSQDRLISLGPTGVVLTQALVGTAQLPNLSLG